MSCCCYTPTFLDGVSVCFYVVGMLNFPFVLDFYKSMMSYYGACEDIEY